MKHGLPQGQCLGDVCRIEYKESEEQIMEMLERRRPFIIKNMTQSWPCKQIWNPEYFRSRVGNNQIYYVITENGNVAKYSKIHQMPMSEFLDRLESMDECALQSGDSKSLYLVVTRIMSHHNRNTAQLPVLLSDITIPHFIPYERLWQVNLWLGKGSNKSNLHFDPEENLLSPIIGVKNVLLFSPEYDRFLYKNNERGTNMLQSKVDVFNFEPDQFPLVNKAYYYQTQVQENETLFIPAGWWHAVESSPTLNIAVNIIWLVKPYFLLRFHDKVTKDIYDKDGKWKSVLSPNKMINLGGSTGVKIKKIGIN